MFFNMLGQHERALAAYRDSHRADPSHVGTLRTMAWLEAHQERWVAAQAWFERAIEVEPDDAHTWFNLGYVRDRGGMDEAAVVAMQQATELMETPMCALYELDQSTSQLTPRNACS